MKNSLFITIILFFITSCINAQNLTSTDFNSNAAGRPIQFNNFRQQAAILSGSFASFNKSSAVPAAEGSVYLFDSWKNKTTIKIDKKNYTFSNFNFNIDKEEFMSQIEGDSIYIFDFKNIDKIIINGKEFKSFYNPIEKKEKIFQVIYETTDFSILKKYSLKIVEGSPNPMLNRSKDKILKIETYIMRQGNTFTPFKLKKKYISNLVKKNIAISALEDYVKSNNLSYKNENDLKKIFDYSYNIDKP
ncbi:hypothetical protein [Aquimarina sp. RZ0]|uniref:hypothetical protein n=1 Tax=Aquimarina sp. RZ0 TaxID=2607730 RepID=UPI0011F2D428|nr:hypothetical protein [Aquimarina sp. RZ0]KAA1245707.1 hypothetical protein F0000_10730 [Aquimarina sp. RZ0]